MNTLRVLFLFWLSSCVLQASVVINEIMIDPVGADEGNEWIELFNPSSEPVNLFGWKIQSAGTDFSTNYTFQEYLLEPFTFLLIAESNIFNAQIYANLSFQNGGSASDAIRLINADESYTDTFVYDSPNTNLLPDDIENPAIIFFTGLESGCSVSRIQDGLDSNSINDWCVSDVATPGTSNTNFVDVEISNVYVSVTESGIHIHTIIHNLSTIPVDISTLCAEYLIDNVSYDLQPVSEFNSENVSHLSTNFSFLCTGVHQLKIIIHCLPDINLLNNAYDTHFLIGEPPLVINEIMHSPSTGNPEWIELYNQSDSTFTLENFVIIDRSGGRISCTGSIASHQYLVLTPNQSALMTNYSFLSSDNIIQTNSWASLNNSGDDLSLYIYDNILADSVSYPANTTPQGVSLERYVNNNQIQWIANQLVCGASPGQQNTLQNQTGQLLVGDIKLIESENSILHVFSLFNDNEPLDVRVQIYENNEQLQDNLAYDHDFLFADSLNVQLSTQKYNNQYTFYTYRFSYFVNNHEITFMKKNAWLNNCLPWVINEIMYNPFSDEPEWIEIKTNHFCPDADSLILFASQDKVIMPVLDSEYLIVTSTRSDSLWLKNHYNLENIPVFYGLASLSNYGEEFTLEDKYGNLIEQFSYNPNWSKIKGCSIERKFPNINASDQNWGACRQNNTIGMRNSLYIESPETGQTTKITPRVFSPFRSEQTCFSFYSQDNGVSFKVIIFDINGVKVKELSSNLYDQGNYLIIWDGKDKDQKNVLPGIYPVYLEAGLKGKNILRKKDKIIIGY